MNDTRKSQFVIVLSANLILSVLVCFAIYNTGYLSRKGSGVKPPPAVKPAYSPGSGAEGSKTSARTEDKKQESATTGSELSLPVTRSAKGGIHGIAVADKTPGTLKSSAPEADRDNDSPGSLKKIPALPESKTTRPGRKPVMVPPPPAMASPSGSAAVEPERSREPGGASAWGNNVQSKMAGITVTAVIGNKAMLSLRRFGSGRHERPEIICLAPGEKVTTPNNVPVSVIAVEPYQVTLEIDGERFVRSLPQIR